MAKITLKASGSQAPGDMTAGEYIVRCTGGEIARRGNKISAVLTVLVVGRCVDGVLYPQHEGVTLKQWYSLGEIKAQSADAELSISPHSKYGQAWQLAMGRPLKASDDVDPSAFANKIFRVDVGYSSSSGGEFSYKHVAKRKGPRDFLRIHTVLEKIEENALTHMGSYGAIIHVHEHGHEHDHEASAPTPALTQAVAQTGLRSTGRLVMGNEQRSQGHANLAPGESQGITTDDVLQTFPGAKLKAVDGGRR